LLERFVRQGVPLTTASDAHRLEDVAERSADLAGLLAGLEVDTLRAFRRREPHDVPSHGMPSHGMPSHGGRRIR
jgi:hypothetical protein